MKSNILKHNAGKVFLIFLFIIFFPSLNVSCENSSKILGIWQNEYVEFIEFTKNEMRRNTSLGEIAFAYSIDNNQLVFETFLGRTRIDFQLKDNILIFEGKTFNRVKDKTFSQLIGEYVGKPQTIIPTESPFVDAGTSYSFYDGIDIIRTKTKDSVDHYVTVEIIIGYDLNNQSALLEITSKKDEVHGFLRKYFAQKYASELELENEQKLKYEILELINTRLFDVPRARIIVFQLFEVIKIE